MPLPRESVHDDDLVRHVLGALPEEQAQRVEEAAMVDDEVAARLQRVEDDLVDAYARGALEGERLARFESFYLASPRRRDRVEFAKRFVAAVDATPTPAALPPAIAAPERARWVPWMLAAAAALLLATGTLLVQHIRLRDEITQATRRLAAAEQRADAASGQLAAHQRATAVVPQAAAPAPVVPPPSLIALVLLPQTRGADPVPTVALPQGAKTLPLYLKIEGDPGAQYSAALRDPVTNGIVWRSAPLALDRTRHPSIVPVHVPGSLLKPQHYTLDLFAVGGTAEFAGSYAFEVVR